MSSDNYFVVRKHPSVENGYTYVTGFESDYNNLDTSVFVDIPVQDHHPIFHSFDDAMNAALEDYSEYGVVTHPECASEDAMASQRGYSEITE